MAGSAVDPPGPPRAGARRLRPMRVRTDRLELVAATAGLVSAAATDLAALSRDLAARVPLAWPPESMADVMDYLAGRLAAEPESAGWLLWYILRDGQLPNALPGPTPDRVLIGGAGFKGRPKADGTAEVGYTVLEEFQRRGYASEAVGGLVDWAFAHPQVRRVVAHTFERHVPSLGVLRRNGFAYAGPGTEAVDEAERQGRGALVLYELTRAAWERRRADPAAPCRPAVPR